MSAKGSIAPSASGSLATAPILPSGLPLATVGIDATGDGRPNYFVTGIDSTGTGVPDALQAQVSQPRFAPGYPFAQAPVAPSVPSVRYCNKADGLLLEANTVFVPQPAAVPLLEAPNLFVPLIEAPNFAAPKVSRSDSVAVSPVRYTYKPAGAPVWVLDPVAPAPAPSQDSMLVLPPPATPGPAPTKKPSKKVSKKASKKGCC
mmetsp:Transcript_112772/g.176162  ORF Transcript_112772/g.176162 Transcript_112772/m.176162 type:complete len:203 (+) Transcript_112772:91-699(+)